MKIKTKRFIVRLLLFAAICGLIIIYAPKFAPVIKEKFSSKESVKEMADKISEGVDKANDQVGKGLKKAGDGIGKGIDKLRG